MQRRKFLAGMGSLAAGGAAAVGTGAFSFANVERGISVNVTGDSNSFLALTQGQRNDEYVDTSGNEINLVFNGNSGTSGAGVNQDSDYLFRDVFRVSNQGTQDVGIWFNDFKSAQTPGAGTSQDGPVKWYIQRFDNNGDLTGGLIEAGGNNPAPDLSVGETVAVCPTILLRGSSSSSDLPDVVRVYADKAAYGGSS